MVSGSLILLGFNPKVKTYTEPADGQLLTFKKFVGFGILTAVVMNSAIFWDMTPCSPLKVNRCFGGTLPPSSGSINKLSKKPE
jgi:hypothetical protein